MFRQRQTFSVDHLRRHKRPVVELLTFLTAALFGAVTPAYAQEPNIPTPDADDAQRAILRSGKLQQAVAVCETNDTSGWEAAVTDFESDSIRLMAADKPGGYRTAAQLDSPRGPRALVCADFNRDGIQDLASANFFSGEITVLIGQGGLTFAPPRTVRLEPGVATLVASDFNTDDLTDLAVGNFLSGEITILRGTGGGAFETQSRLGPARAVALLVYAGKAGGGDSPRRLIAFDATGRQAWLMAGEPGGFFGSAVQIEASEAVALMVGTSAHADVDAAQDSPTVTKVGGDGQSAAAGSAIPEPLRVAIGTRSAREYPQQQVAFSKLHGDARLDESSPRESDEGGQASASVLLGRSPGNVLVAGGIMGGPAAVFGVIATLPNAEFFQAARVAIAQRPADPADVERQLMLLGNAERKLEGGDEVGAVADLVALGLTARADVAPKPAAARSAEASQATGSPEDTLRRLVNQVLLFGSISPAAVIGAISCGQTLPGSLPAGQVNSYTFSGTAGESVQFTAVTTSGVLCTTASLFNPSGALMRSTSCNSSAGPVVLPVTGTYRIDVSDDNRVDAGTYNLNLQFTTGRCAAAIACGQTLAGNIAAKAAMTTHKFTGNAGEAVQITAATTSGTACTRTNLFNPAGAFMATTSCNSSAGPIVLPSTGTYTVMAYDDNFQQTGGYNLNLQFTTGRCATAIICGQTLAGSIAAKAAMTTHKFTGNAGEAVQITAVTTSGTACTRTNLFNSSGAFMATTSCNSSAGPTVLPATGTYTVMAYDDNFQETGGYNLNLQFTTGRCATAITCGQTLAGNITAKAAMTTHKFTGNAGEAVQITAATTSGTACTRTNLFNPSGVFMATTSCNSSVGPTVLPATGTYTVMAYDDNFQEAGTYNLNLQFTTGRCASAIACGQTLAGNIAGKTSMTTHKFTGNAGEAVQITAVTTSGTACTRTNLFNPAGGFMATTSCNSSAGPIILPSPGAYTIMAYDDNFQEAGTYNLNLQFTTGRCASTIACGQTLGGNIAAKAAMTTQKFSGNAGEAVQITAVTTSGTACTRANLFNPAGRFMATTSCNSSAGPIVLPATGTYTVMAYDDNFQETGTYNLNLQFTTGRCASAIACGQTLAGSIGAKAAMTTRKFSGNAGEAVQITAVTTSGTACIRTNLFNPAGGFMATTACNSSAGPVVLPSTGTYTVMAYDDNFQETGAYNLNLQFLTGRCASWLPCSQTKSGSISGKAAMATYGFGATAGQVFTMTGTTTLGTVCTRLNLYSPSGGFVAATPCNGSTAPITLPATGAYTILAYDDNFQETGAFNVTWRFTNGCPTCRLSATGLSFGTQLVGTTSQSRSVTLTNTGTAIMTIVRRSIAGVNPSDFVHSSTCGLSLAVGASCTVGASFRPRAGGTRSAAISMFDNAPGAPHAVSLTGTGLPLRLVPASLAFGNRTVGTTSAPMQVTLTNVAASTITISGISLTGVSAGSFLMTHNCGSTLAAGASCAVSASFRPATAGAKTAAVTISHDGGASPQSIPLSGTGVL